MKVARLRALAEVVERRLADLALDVAKLQDAIRAIESESITSSLMAVDEEADVPIPFRLTGKASRLLAGSQDPAGAKPAEPQGKPPAGSQDPAPAVVPPAPSAPKVPRRIPPRGQPIPPPSGSGVQPPPWFGQREEAVSEELISRCAGCGGTAFVPKRSLGGRLGCAACGRAV